jgi:hypothetical protein
VKGATVCATHGGTAPQVKARAEARLAEQAMHAEVAKLGVPLEVDPREAFLQTIFLRAAEVEFYRRRVADLSVDEALEHPIAKAYDAAVEKLARWSAKAIELRIAEHEVQVAKAYGEQMLVLLRSFAVALGLPADDERVVTAMRASLLELAPRRVT